MVSAPGVPAAQSPPVVSEFAFALLIASRREQTPSVIDSSFVVLTVIVVAAYAGLTPTVPNVRLQIPSSVIAAVRSRRFISFLLARHRDPRSIRRPAGQSWLTPLTPRYRGALANRAPASRRATAVTRARGSR